MKSQSRMMFLFVINGGLLFLSYIASIYLNSYFGIDSSFVETLEPWLFQFISIKIFVMALFVFTCMNRFDHVIMTVGALIANAAAYGFLFYYEGVVDNYSMYMVLAGVEIILINILGAVYNISSPKESKKEEDEHEQREAEIALMGMNSKIAEKKAVIKELENKLDSKEIRLNEIIDKVEKVKAEEEENALKSISCPIRIDIGIDDLKKCFDKYHQVETKEKQKNEGAENQKKPADKEALSLKEKELKERASVVKSKERIIEQTIQNLEQISKTIKERMTLLEEKESYVKKQLKLIEEREDGYTQMVQNKIYETIFNDPEIIGDEVKLKDNTREIIIDKNDLSEIRKMIEKAVEEEMNQ
ncbi:hypothetical protein [Alkalibacter saccharofermentans]|nr:hypothetical protein [Alkalibacter saccharofermentans]